MTPPRDQPAARARPAPNPAPSAPARRGARRGRGAAAFALAAGLSLAPGCRKATTEAQPSPATSASAPAPRPPVDQASPGELAEGTEKAFGLPIPRRMRVRARFPDAVFAVGDVTAERLANYVRERVIAANVETGPAKTVFARATVKSAPQRVIRIEVVARAQTTELVIRDDTKPAAEQGLSVEEQWRRKGLRPDGTPLDPTRLE